MHLEKLCLIGALFCTATYGVDDNDYMYKQKIKCIDLYNKIPSKQAQQKLLTEEESLKKIGFKGDYALGTADERRKIILGKNQYDTQLLQNLTTKELKQIANIWESEGYITAKSAEDLSPISKNIQSAYNYRKAKKVEYQEKN